MKPLKALRSVVSFTSFEINATKRRLAHAASVDDLRLIAQRRLPVGIFDYIDGGADDEIALARNGDAIRSITFRPRILSNLTDVDPSTTIIGYKSSIPLILAPTGFTRIVSPEGELAVARAADKAGIPYTLSTLGTRSIEEVRAVSGGRLWFQVYAWRDRGLVKEMIQRARVSNYEALVLTVDTAVLGRRERDVRRGFTLPPTIGLRTILDGARHPAWTWAFLRSDPIRFSNVVGTSIADGATPVNLSEFINSQFDPGLSWKDVEWLQSLWSGPIILKGVQRVEDARIAADSGVTAIVLSNHGGRQLDSAPSPYRLIAPIADAVGGRTEIFCDGGVRRGSDIVKAVAAGATAAMAGRAYLYALGAAGETGVERVLEWFRSDVVRTLSLVGASSVAELDSSFLNRPDFDERSPGLEGGRRLNVKRI